jgi:hypothetical protein
MDLLRTVLGEYDSIRPYYHAYIEALARSARSPELREQLAAHYNRQRDRVAGLLTGSKHQTTTLRLTPELVCRHADVRPSTPDRTPVRPSAITRSG